LANAEDVASDGSSSANDDDDDEGVMSDVIRADAIADCINSSSSSSLSSALTSNKLFMEVISYKAVRPT